MLIPVASDNEKVISPLPSVDSPVSCFDTNKFEPDKLTSEIFASGSGANNPDFSESLIVGTFSDKVVFNALVGNPPVHIPATVLIPVTVILSPLGSISTTLFKDSSEKELPVCVYPIILPVAIPVNFLPGHVIVVKDVAPSGAENWNTSVKLNPGNVSLWRTTSPIKSAVNPAKLEASWYTDLISLIPKVSKLLIDLECCVLPLILICSPFKKVPEVWVRVTTVPVVNPVTYPVAPLFNPFM